jgi:hypothetical protein
MVFYRGMLVDVDRIGIAFREVGRGHVFVGELSIGDGKAKASAREAGCGERRSALADEE